MNLYEIHLRNWTHRTAAGKNILKKETLFKTVGGSVCEYFNFRVALQDHILPLKSMGHIRYHFTIENGKCSS